MKFFFNHSYVPETIVSDLGTSFTSSLMDELTKLLEVKLKHASLKHPQTIGAVERSKTIKKNLESEHRQTMERLSQVCTVSNFHTQHIVSYINWMLPPALFHGQEPVKPLDLRFARKSMEAVAVNSDYVVALQDAMMTKFEENKLQLIDSYQRYRNYYDKKAEAKPLKLHSYCLLLNPKLTSQKPQISKVAQVWIPLYRVENQLIP